MLNHIPVVGMGFGLALVGLALLRKSEEQVAFAGVLVVGVAALGGLVFSRRGKLNTAS
ncbi:MAG: hypothetical protein WBV90_04340 [Terrimicrobiaceae bacterium]